jgi:hypothetical protein
MTKVQLQELLDQRDKELSLSYEQIRKYREEIENLEKLRQSDKKQAIVDTENHMYEQWKTLNGKFLKRYISELFQSHQLSFDFESEYNGYFDMNVLMDGKKLSEYSGQISMGYDGLQE